ncbi:filamentation protein [Pochonia chlamydosporia 170]|uniref:Filamentation protein n=1 Tax=Pochonia chlamydosporia 170 TaxID=1380566 RepID=A0A179FXI3_METCM|nr:filamentation protein [Pochonia chlamydosporia 170]OAQ70087.1 filamentation protein [Pochonia chlamydosporia 170]
MNPKAASYIDQLNSARCEGNWEAVPELVRKVRKHAPERQSLTLAAETEAAISQATSSGARPSAAQTAQDLDVASRFPKLAAAIEEEHHHHEDRFQAKVCTGWLHWVVGEYHHALSTLPSSLEAEGISQERTDTISEWTNLCALKSAYLKANCLMRNDQRAAALSALQSATPSLNGVWCGHGVRKQLRYWSELFLTEYCMLSSQAVENEELNLDDPNSLASFRAWARYWDVMGAPITGGFGFKGSVPRRRIWAEYYEALSRILENDLAYVGGHVDTISPDLSARAQLRLEIKQTEAAYRALILTETTFPRADEDREEVEDFVKRVMANWTILCGRGWREQDLGPGGRAALSRNVLETLYSAATRTYHSTSILRSLFSVHLALAEFDLAFKAFDSYLDIVKKGKARVDKTGHEEASLDDDGTVLETIAQAVMALCRYGHQSAGEKARQLGAELEDWLSRLPHTKSTENGVAPHDQEPRMELRTLVAPNIIALSWQAIGLSHAHWSRITHEAASRTEIQSKAIRCIRKSLAAEFGRSKDIRSFFSLALLLAERRELTAAIELVRSALLCNKGQEERYSLYHGPYWQERTLIPVWHLLALLLSARQDYTMAARACEGALEQFGDSTILFGKTEAHCRSDHLKDVEVNGNSELHPPGLVDDMEDSEKESILEVKMTQLALVELVEGPDAAVNASYELLSLFSRLFGTFPAQPSIKSPTPSLPPKTSGTIRSIRGSIFGGKTDRSRPPTRQPSSSTVSEKSGVPTSRPATSHSSRTATPAIQVTDEKENVNGTGSTSRRGSTHRQRSNSRRRNSLKKRDRSGSRTRPVTAIATSHQPTMLDGETFFTPTTEGDSPDFFNLNKLPVARAPSLTRGKTVSSVHSVMTATSKSSDVTELTVDVTHASPNLLPLIQFSKEKAKAQKISLLIKIWLSIAGFYRRASMLDDGKAAVLEAQKLLAGMESEAARDQANTGATKGLGWAERKSMDDLWGDVWSELGLLGVAKGLPFEAKSDFETALTHSPDHAAATVGLSNILLDIFSEKVLPPPTMPALDGLDHNEKEGFQPPNQTYHKRFAGTLPSSPLGLGPSIAAPISSLTLEDTVAKSKHDQLPVPYKATYLPLVDRLAARERAFTLLSGLTRLGNGWDNSEAWFALARAHEESGQPDKAKEVLWWCVELEEAMGVREWRCLGNGGYII